MTITACRYAIVAEDDPPTRYRIDDDRTGTVARGRFDRDLRGLTLRRARAEHRALTDTDDAWLRAARAYDLAFRNWDTARRDPYDRAYRDWDNARRADADPATIADLYAALVAARDALATTPDPRDLAEQDS